MPHPITLTSPLPPQDLRFAAMQASAGLSRLGETRLEMISERADLKAEDLLGKPLGIAIELREGSKRHLHGYVTRFGLAGHRGRYFRYEATVRPWLWFLTRTTDCRIFQELTVPDIVKRVFDDHGVASFEFKLFRSYRSWTYCVQYRETDYQFVARLLEHEGIYWYFDHSEAGHTLVLVDSQSAHDARAGYERLPYYDSAQAMPPDLDHVSSWTFAREVTTGKVAGTSYDFERPSARLLGDDSRERPHELSGYERFDFQGDYTQLADGRQLLENRLDELQSAHEALHGSSNAEGLCSGHLLSLERHPREDQNAEYLITSDQIDAVQPTGEAGDGEHRFRCRFTAIPSQQQFRPPRLTPKPAMQGPQTAVVVGPAGEELHTDKYGRVKVQFHWDRYGAKDDRSSCWIRVSHPWAGKNFGAIHIPRIGQEVVVDFLEGDPDQPLITGRVYNAEQMPPWELPANATQSGLLTRSSKGGAYSNANAIRFEDKKGSEQLWIHAEKNQDIEVESDETHWVGHDRRKTVDHDETTVVKHDRTETVGNNETISVGLHRIITVGANETATVAVQRTHVVGANESIAVGAAQEIAVGAAQIVTIGAQQAIRVGSDQTVDIADKKTTTIGNDEKRSIGANRTTEVASDDLLQVGRRFVVQAGDEITLTTGDASIVMKKDGTIQIKGKDITVIGGGKVGVKASGELVLKGAKIAQN